MRVGDHVLRGCLEIRLLVAYGLRHDEETLGQRSLLWFLRERVSGRCGMKQDNYFFLLCHHEKSSTVCPTSRDPWRAGVRIRGGDRVGFAAVLG